MTDKPFDPTKPLSLDQIEELERLEKAATPAPWRKSMTKARLGGGALIRAICDEAEGINLAWVTMPLKAAGHNLALLLAMRNALPALLKMAREHAEMRKALEGLLDHAERNQCHHEDIYRGGATWTICAGCGKRWANDEGGFQLYVEPEEITIARAALKRGEP